MKFMLILPISIIMYIIVITKLTINRGRNFAQMCSCG